MLECLQKGPRVSTEPKQGNCALFRQGSGYDAASLEACVSRPFASLTALWGACPVEIW